MEYDLVADGIYLCIFLCWKNVFITFMLLCNTTYFSFSCLLLKIISPNVPIFFTSLLPVIALESSISSKASDLLTLSIIVGIIYENLLCSALLKRVHICGFSFNFESCFNFVFIQTVVSNELECCINEKYFFSPHHKTISL